MQDRIVARSSWRGVVPFNRSSMVMTVLLAAISFVCFSLLQSSPATVDFGHPENEISCLLQKRLERADEAKNATTPSPSSVPLGNEAKNATKKVLQEVINKLESQDMNDAANRVKAMKHDPKTVEQITQKVARQGSGKEFTKKVEIEEEKDTVSKHNVSAPEGAVEQTAIKEIAGNLDGMLHKAEGEASSATKMLDSMDLKGLASVIKVALDNTLFGMEAAKSVQDGTKRFKKQLRSSVKRGQGIFDKALKKGNHTSILVGTGLILSAAQQSLAMTELVQNALNTSDARIQDLLQKIKEEQNAEKKDKEEKDKEKEDTKKTDKEKKDKGKKNKDDTDFLEGKQAAAADADTLEDKLQVQTRVAQRLTNSAFNVMGMEELQVDTVGENSTKWTGVGAGVRRVIVMASEGTKLTILYVKHVNATVGVVEAFVKEYKEKPSKHLAKHLGEQLARLREMVIGEFDFVKAEEQEDGFLKEALDGLAKSPKDKSTSLPLALVGAALFALVVTACIAFSMQHF